MNMPKWAKYILEVSTAEEGGPYSDFSFEAKLDDLQCIFQALTSIGWAFERLARPALWIQDEIQALELRQALYKQRMVSTNTSSNDSYGFGSISDGQLSSRKLDELLDDIIKGGGSAEQVQIADGSRELLSPGRQDSLNLRMLSSLLG